MSKITITLKGRLGADFDLLLFDGNNGEVNQKVQGVIAYDESKFDSKSGSWTSETRWYRIESTRTSVVNDAKFLRKGAMCKVTGSLTYSTYQHLDPATNSYVEKTVPLVKIEEIEPCISLMEAYWYNTRGKDQFYDEGGWEAVKSNAQAQPLNVKDYRSNPSSSYGTQSNFVQQQIQGGNSQASQGPFQGPFRTSGPSQQGFNPTGSGSSSSFTGGSNSNLNNEIKFAAPPAPAIAQQSVATNNNFVSPTVNRFASARLGGGNSSTTSGSFGGYAPTAPATSTSSTPSASSTGFGSSSSSSSSASTNSFVIGNKKDS